MHTVPSVIKSWLDFELVDNCFALNLAIIRSYIIKLRILKIMYAETKKIIA